MYFRLQSCEHRDEVPTRGSAGTKFYALADLRKCDRREIEKRAKKARFPTAADFVRNAGRPFQAAAPLAEIAIDDLAEARRWRDNLCPILTRRGDKPVAELAREYRAACADGGNEPPPLWKCERVIKLVLDRVGPHEDFEPLNLYVAPKPNCLPKEGEIPVASSTERVASQCRPLDNLDWLALMRAADRRVGEGASEFAVKKEIMIGVIPRSEYQDKARRHAWQQRYSAKRTRWIDSNGDPDVLIDRRKTKELRDENFGRPAKFSPTGDEARALRLLVLKKGSFPVAVEWFAQSSDCRPETRELIHAELDRAARARCLPHWPDSLRRAGHVTADERAAFRGPKHLMEVEFTDRRGLEWIDEDGSRRPMAANTIWESDDMSSNEPFTWSEGGELRIGRQSLFTLDVYSSKGLGVSAIGRERDAYRAEDIADHMANCVRAHGLPTIWRLERGAWENNFVDGVLIGRKPDGTEIRWGGLSPLIRIVRAWKSRQKGTVETWFNLFQKYMAHEGASIGRTRGEFEAVTKLYLRAAKGVPDALARFWSMDEYVNCADKTMRMMNGRAKERRAHGRAAVVPDDLFHDSPRREVPEDQWWRFLPEKREATVRHGHIECTVNHYPLRFRFQVNGVNDGLYLEHGYPVLIAFHPGHPEDGCHVFNAERGPRNREGWPHGKPLLVAPMAEDAPQVNLMPQERTFHARKNANATMRSNFRAITGVGTSSMGKTIARDGWGNSAVIERAMPDGPEPVGTDLSKRRDSADVVIERARKMRYEPRAEISENENAELRAKEDVLLRELGMATT